MDSQLLPDISNVELEFFFSELNRSISASSNRNQANLKVGLEPLVADFKVHDVFSELSNQEGKVGSDISLPAEEVFSDVGFDDAQVLFYVVVEATECLLFASNLS